MGVLRLNFLPLELLHLCNRYKGKIHSDILVNLEFITYVYKWPQMKATLPNVTSHYLGVKWDLPE